MFRSCCLTEAMWSSQDGDGGQLGHVTARMETTPGFGTPSISVSQQQVPKKFAPVVAPKPKFNPYKQLSESAQSGGEFDLGALKMESKYGRLLFSFSITHAKCLVVTVLEKALYLIN